MCHMQCFLGCGVWGISEEMASSAVQLYHDLTNYQETENNCVRYYWFLTITGFCSNKLLLAGLKNISFTKVGNSLF